MGHPPPARPPSPLGVGRDSEKGNARNAGIGPDTAAHYELRIARRLDGHWSAWFGGLTLTRETDGTTTLRGVVTDQAELHCLLAKVRDLGVTLISVNATGAAVNPGPNTTEIDGDTQPRTGPVQPDPADCHHEAMSTELAALTWPRHTARLTLRPASSRDADATWRFRRRDGVTRWLTSAPATQDAHRTWFQAPDTLARTLLIERDGAVIGDLMVKVEDAWAQAEILERAHSVQAELGWVLDPEHAGHGYATEAVRELLRLCFDDLGLRRVTAVCFAANDASWRLMERVGMRRELHTVRDSLHRSGEWLDGLGYALLADEWRASA